MLKQIFISDAFAQVSEVAATPAAPENSFTSFIPLVLIFAIFYFLIVRPQSKKMKEHQALIKNLKSGDKVVTNSGIIGVITAVYDDKNQFEVEIAPDVRIKLLKNYVVQEENDEGDKVKVKKSSVTRISDKKSKK